MAKEQTTAEKKKIAAEAKAKAEEKAKAKAAKEAEKAAKAKEREEAKAAKQKEKEEARKALIDSGALIVDGDTEYVEVDKSDKPAKVDNRTAQVIEKLKAAKGKPVMGKDLHDELGGSWALMIPIFSTLKALGLVKEYRRRTGERGGSGLAYTWIG